MKPRTDGLFTRGERHSDEMKAKIRKAVARHWATTRKRSDNAVAAAKKEEEIDKWLQGELAELRRKGMIK